MKEDFSTEQNLFLSQFSFTIKGSFTLTFIDVNPIYLVSKFISNIVSLLFIFQICLKISKWPKNFLAFEINMQL